MIWVFAGSPVPARNRKSRKRERLVAVYPRRAAPRAPAPSRAASSTGSPSSARRRCPPAARSSVPRAPPRRLRGQGLEHDQRPNDLLTVRALVLASPAPLEPPRLRAGQRRVGVLDRRRVLVGEVPRQREPFARALRAMNSASTFPSATCSGSDVVSRNASGPGSCDRTVGGELDPRRDRSVVRAQGELHPHRDPASQAFDDAHQTRRSLAASGHEVDHPDRAVRRLELASRARGFPAGSDETLARVAPAGASSQRPCRSSPSSAEKHEGESKRGRQSQSIDPLRPTRAAACRSPTMP